MINLINSATTRPDSALQQQPKTNHQLSQRAHSSTSPSTSRRGYTRGTLLHVKSLDACLTVPPRPTKSHSLRSSHVAARAQDAERLPASLPKVIGHRGAKVRASLLTGYICALILHVSSCSYVCVLILLCILLCTYICVLILLYICPHTTMLSRR